MPTRTVTSHRLAWLSLFLAPVITACFLVEGQTTTEECRPCWDDPNLVDPKLLAGSINRYVAMGEANAMRQLFRIRDGSVSRPTDEYSPILMARLLYLPRNVDQPLRQPDVGDFGLFWHDAPKKDWPFIPFVEQDGVFFTMNYPTGGTGLRESLEEYVQYCRQEGSFRTKRVPIPTTQQTRKALNHLFASDRWRNIKWTRKEPGFSNDYNYKFVRQDLLGQAGYLPDRLNE